MQQNRITTPSEQIIQSLKWLCMSLMLVFSMSISAKERVIILTDVENEPDDTESLVRLMLYTNEIDVRGLIATTSTHMRNRVYPETILKIIDAYAKVRGNLKLHASGYPEAEALRQLVKKGPALYGMEGIGEGKDTEGSDWIISELEQKDERPLWVCAWGGTNVLAQALWKMRATKSKSQLKAMLSKLRIYTISDQDDTGIWIRKNFPTLFYIVSPGGYGNAAWGGMNSVEPGADNEKISNQWIAENIQQGHGPLGACYPDVSYGMEGDTPSWLSLIPNGLNAPEHPEWGGWGGRYQLYCPKREDCDPNGFNGNVPIEDEPHAIWTNAVDEFYPFVPKEYGCGVRQDSILCRGYRATIWRWRTEIQNDFAARMDWCIKPYTEANHQPVAVLSHPNELTAHAGDVVTLDAINSSDPDGDSISFLWFCYPEAGGKAAMTWGAQNFHPILLKIQDDAQPQDIHVILKVTDKGTPALSSYQRVIVHVKK